MVNWRNALGAAGLLAMGAPAIAGSTPVTIQAQCTGKDSGSKVAVRWGRPDAGHGNYIPIFTTHCNTGMKTTGFSLTDAESEFEIQTEGGHETGYAVTVMVSGRTADKLSTIVLRHQSSDNYVVRGGGFTLNRSKGPNRYGEQNFRVKLDKTPATAKLSAQVSGGSNAKMTVRWGHPGFDDTPYLKPWFVVRPGGMMQTGPVRITDEKSQFEIQTEGGQQTAYKLSISLDTGSGPPAQPSIEIAHDSSVANDSRDAVFKTEGDGNDYGERNVKVIVPWLASATPPSACSGSAGTGCLTINYNYGFVAYTVQQSNPIMLRFTGDQAAPPNSHFDEAITRSLNYGSASSGGGQNSFPYTRQGLLPGMWTVVIGVTDPRETPRPITCKVTIAAGVNTMVLADRASGSCH